MQCIHFKIFPFLFVAWQLDLHPLAFPINPQKELPILSGFPLDGAENCPHDGYSKNLDMGLSVIHTLAAIRIMWGV